MNKKHRKLELIGRFFDGSKGYFIIAVLASLAATFLNAVIPQIFRFSIDTVLSGEGSAYLAGHLWIISLVIAGVALLSALSQYINGVNKTKAGEDFANNIRDTLFIHIQKLPMKWHDQNQTGDIIQRCTSDVEVIRNFVVTQLLEVFRTLFLIVVSFGMMASMNLKLSLVALAFVPVVVGYSALFYRLIAKRFSATDEAEGALSTVVQENATGVRVVRAFGREKFEMDRFREKNDKFADLWIRLGTLLGIYWGVGDFIAGLQVILIVVLGTMDAVNGRITVGEFVAFASYNTAMVWPIRGLGRILSDMSKASVSFERVEYIIGGEEEAYGKEWDKELESFDITFSGVNYGYDSGETVLKDLSFEIPQGQTFGILGGTGVGKSTIIQLLMRLYELSEREGRICIGGRNIQDIPLEQLRKYIGVVLQEPFLYSRTIKENIAASAPGASMEEIREAAEIACIDAAIMNFPDGYDTLVGERGVTLSGGQRQRVAIARMLLQKAPIMIFDDSLSAVDSQTDTRIRKALNAHRKDGKQRTVILISHRVTSLMGADRIMVLDGGRIEEIGTHNELIHRQGIYRRIYEIQMSYDDRKKVEADGSR